MESQRLKAAQQGEHRYHGKPCRACRETERFVANGNCVACAAQHSQKYREKIRELIKKARAGGDN